MNQCSEIMQYSNFACTDVNCHIHVKFIGKSILKKMEPTIKYKNLISVCFLKKTFKYRYNT